jgi:hypothetical protein
MKYKIEGLEKKTTQTGKPFIKAKLQDETGQVVDNVSIWSDFPNFHALNPGAQTDGVIETNPRGFRNLKPVMFYRSLQERHDRVMGPDARRTEAIRAAQDRKYETISYFNSVNSAISLVSSMRNKLVGQNTSRSVMKQEITYWRDWFIEEWKRYESDGFTPHDQPGS